MREILMITVVLLVLCVVMIGGALQLYSVICKNKYADYQATYGIVAGCQINVEGKRIPAENFRVI